MKLKSEINFSLFFGEISFFLRIRECRKKEIMKMEKLDVEFELFRKRVYNLEIRSFYLLLLNRGCDIETLRALFSDVDEKLALKMDGMFYRAQSDQVQEVLEKVIKQEKTNARMDCFDKLFEKGMDIFEVLELIGISQNDIELINDAAYVWQDKHL